MPRRIVYMQEIVLFAAATQSREFRFSGGFIATAAAAEKYEQNGQQRAATANFLDDVSDAAATAAAKEYYDEQPKVTVVIGKTKTVNHIFFSL